MSTCVVCFEVISRRQQIMCDNCLQAKHLIQSSAELLMRLHGVPMAAGLCVDCNARPATARDHRHYSKPLEVDAVCGPCNHARGHAKDLFKLIRQHRGIEKIESDIIEDAVFSIPSDLQQHLDGYERKILRAALQAKRHNRTQAARALGITMRAMRYRMERLKIS